MAAKRSKINPQAIFDSCLAVLRDTKALCESRKSAQLMHSYNQGKEHLTLGPALDRALCVSIRWHARTIMEALPLLGLGDPSKQDWKQAAALKMVFLAPDSMRPVKPFGVHIVDFAIGDATEKIYESERYHPNEQRYWEGESHHCHDLYSETIAVLLRLEDYRAGNNGQRRGRLPKADSEAARATMRAKLSANPRLIDTPDILARECGVSERQVQRWYKEDANRLRGSDHYRKQQRED